MIHGSLSLHEARSLSLSAVQKLGMKRLSSGIPYLCSIPAVANNEVL